MFVNVIRDTSRTILGITFRQHSLRGELFCLSTDSVVRNISCSFPVSSKYQQIVSLSPMKAMKAIKPMKAMKAMGLEELKNMNVKERIVAT